MPMKRFAHLSYSEARKAITPEMVREVLDYDPASGVMQWRARPVFRSQDQTWNTRFADQPVGRADRDGYLRFTLMGIQVLVHRAAWAHVHNEWPPQMIDHRDGNRINNAISNLRLADVAQNTANARKRAGTRSRFKGLTWCATHRKWKATVQRRGVTKLVGYFDDEETAHAAYCAAAAAVQGEFFRAS